jgi:hypothetical protein
MRKEKFVEDTNFHDTCIKAHKAHSRVSVDAALESSVPEAESITGAIGTLQDKCLVSDTVARDGASGVRRALLSDVAP